MPTYLTPGIYIEEISTGARPIEAVGTSTAAFIGVAPNADAHLHEALGIAPRPAFVLRAPFRQERPEKRAPLVRKSLVVKQLPMRSFGGQIVGPENTPIMNARVDLPSLDLTTTTDSKGRFYFSSVPAVSGARLLVIRAKGQEFSINTQQTASDKEPLVIQLQLEG